MSNWQPPSQRHQPMGNPQQFSADLSQQYQTNYTHQNFPGPSASAPNVYQSNNTGGRYYPPTTQQADISMSSIQLGKVSATTMNPIRSSTSPHTHSTGFPIAYASPPVGFDLRNGPFPAAHLSDGSGSDNNTTSQDDTTVDSTSGIGNTSQQTFGPSPLRRGQACQACRKRKLKCDAVRPVCGTCTRSRKAAASANHVSPVPDGDCVYDDFQTSFNPSLHGQQQASSLSQSLASSTNKARRVSNAHSLKQEMSGNLDAKKPSVQKRRKTFGDEGKRSPLAWDQSDKVVGHADRHMESKVSSLHPLPGETALQRSHRLENRIRELEARLKVKEEQEHSSIHSDAAGQGETHLSERREREVYTKGPTVPIFSMLSPSSGREERYRLQYSQRPAGYQSNTSSSLKNETSFSPQDTKTSVIFDFPEINREDQARNELAHGHFVQDDPILQLLWPGWSADLPSPDTVMTICETFFRLHPMKSLIYKSSFMAGLSLPPKHPHRPHDSLIHAILATTADISPFFAIKRTDTQDRFIMLLSDSRSRQERSHNFLSSDQLSFKEYHLRKSREKVEYSLITEFRNPLDWVAACLLSCFTLWNDFRIIEAYFLSAILSRGASPAGLDKLPSRHFSQDVETDRVPGLFGSPQGVEEHERRMTFWHMFIADQYTGGSPMFYENLLSEQSILTNLPCAVADYQAGRDVSPNPQTLSSPDLFRSGHLDDFTLHIKSAILVRRACTLQCRNQLTKKKPSGLNVVDKQIVEFLDSFPPFNFDNADQISVDKLAAWTNVFLAIFYLHEPYLTPTSISEKDEGNNYSIKRINLAIDKVLFTIHYLMSSSFDFALLHPQVFLTWSVCARMLGKEMDLLKRTAPSTDEIARGQQEIALQQVVEKIHCIVLALERGGEKNIRARRCSELVSYVRSGTLNEGILSQLLYTDGVIPTGDEEVQFGGAGLPSGMNTNDTALEALMMSAASGEQRSSPKMNGLLPQGFHIPGGGVDESQGGHESLHQQIQGNDMLLNFAM